MHKSLLLTDALSAAQRKWILRVKRAGKLRFCFSLLRQISDKEGRRTSRTELWITRAWVRLCAPLPLHLPHHTPSQILRSSQTVSLFCYSCVTRLVPIFPHCHHVIITSFIILFHYCNCIPQALLTGRKMKPTSLFHVSTRSACS